MVILLYHPIECVVSAILPFCLNLNLYFSNQNYAQTNHATHTQASATATAGVARR
jgi:hypothetical protein